jgi:predicted RNA binding protein YcfA (HicA-like mRNA interferase family)
MVTRLPTVTAKTMIRFLESQGFEKVRSRGSHHFFRHPDGRTATVPVHPGEDLGRGLINKILHDVEIDRLTLIAWLEK